MLSYEKGSLTFDNFKLDEILKNYKTPLYVYSEAQIISQYKKFYNCAVNNDINSPLACFALKSNPNLALLKALFKAGAGADIVSGGELKQALKAGCKSNKIVFSGVGKTKEEIEAGLKVNIYSFNVESIEELELINKLAKKMNKKANIALRLNPQVNAKTHKFISTGYKTHKFGILKDDILKFFKRKNNFSHLELKGLSIHIGSQLTDFKATKKALQEVFDLAVSLATPLEFIDVGGGLGVDYHKIGEDLLEKYMSVVAKISSKAKKKYGFNPRIIFEPGRYISASSGIFLTKVIRTKKSGDHSFAIVDGGMNDFVRTSLYQAFHKTIPIKKKSGKKKFYDIVGPICETADSFASNYEIQKLNSDDFLAVLDTGAYGHSMSSTYNMRQRPSEIVIREDHSLIEFKY